MTLDEFIAKYDGKGIDYDGVYGDQCVDLVQQYSIEVLEIGAWGSGNAIGRWENYPQDKFDRIANTPTGVPEKGDVLIWGTGVGQYGHIAVFINGDTNSFNSFDQNWPVGSKCHVQSHDYNNLLGWLHPKNNQGGNVNCDDVRKEYNDKIYHGSRNFVYEARNVILGRSGHPTEAEVEADAQWMLRTNGDKFNLPGFAQRFLAYWNEPEAVAYRKKLVDEAYNKGFKAGKASVPPCPKPSPSTSPSSSQSSSPSSSQSSSPSASQSSSPSPSPAPQKTWWQIILAWIFRD